MNTSDKKKHIGMVRKTFRSVSLGGRNSTNVEKKSSYMNEPTRFGFLQRCCSKPNRQQNKQKGLLRMQHLDSSSQVSICGVSTTTGYNINEQKKKTITTS